jgi:tetratricopeptide (TPR) repeat protein
MNKMKFYKLFLFSILFFFLTVPLKAADAEHIFKEATNAYQQGNYLLAIDKYESILSASVFSKELYYNLGNSYYRINQTGKAVLNYERALRLDPSDKEIQQNLQLSTSHIVENIEPISDIFIVRWVKILRGLFTANTWANFTLIFLWLDIAGFTLWLMSKERLWKKRGFIAGLVFTPLSILLFFLAQKSSSELISAHFGIITAKQTAFKTSADANAPTSFNLHEGIKVEIMERASNMTRIQLPNSEEGWVESNSVEKI